MEAIIKTNNKNLFRSVIQILRSLNFQVETHQEKTSELLRGKDRKANLHFRSLHLKTKGVKFDREEVNER